MTSFGNIPRIHPNQPHITKKQAVVWSIVAAVVLLIIGSRGLAIFYTDFLWFKSVNLTEVWSGLLLTKIALGAACVFVFFVLLWVTVWIADHYAPRVLESTPDDEIARSYRELVGERSGLVRFLFAGLLALFCGMGFAAHWQDWLLFRNGGSFHVKDPQLHTDIGYYVFKLPLISAVLNWTFYALAIGLAVAVGAHYLRGAIRPSSSHNRVSSAARTHFSVLLGLLALAKAAQYYFVQRYDLLFSVRGPERGANYTDVNFLLPALTLLALISVLAAIVIFASSRQRGWTLPVTTVALWAVVSFLIAILIPAGVQKFSVEPAESQKEAKYIQRNIDATRSALMLDKVKMNDFRYQDDLSAEELAKNSQTIRNVRLWDPDYLKSSYQRLQESRSFFKFDDIDVDRYPLNDETTQMMLSLREINTNGLPQDRRSWVNQHLAYTHGYGAVTSPSNAVTSDGKPDFTLKDLPPVGTPELKVPQVYFGENTGEYSIVNSKQREVDFVSVTGDDVTSAYSGKGGVQLSNAGIKAAFALRVGDMKPLISGLVDSKSRAMYLTKIKERTQMAAPFLTFDNDPYPVIADGRIKWVQDAYTLSNRYPYSSYADTSLVDGKTPGSLRDREFNYIRNSVKVVTDAYDGDMKFYVFDAKDPIVNAWSKAFPKMFTDGSQMPDSLRSHIRYPEDLFRTQTQMFGRYHMTDARVFYNKSDRWNIAQKPKFGDRSSSGGTVAGATAAEDRIEPYYLQMRLPNEQKDGFLMFQPFVPYSANDMRKELSAFMVAKCDPQDYGELQAFVMPRDRQVDGPALVEARIQQEPTISQYITLLNQVGSQVDLGNMLIIPVDNSLLYVRPLYVTSRQTSVPEFKKAIVVQGSHIAMEDTLQKALQKIYGVTPETREQSRDSNNAVVSTPQQTSQAPGNPSPAPNNNTTASLPPDQVQALLNQADSEFAQADQALRNGDLAAFQTHVQAGRDAVRKARGA